jgi:hypothetical protein
MCVAGENNEAEYYTKDSKNVRVENGLLIIEAHKDSLGGKSLYIKPVWLVKGRAIGWMVALK